MRAAAARTARLAARNRIATSGLHSLARPGAASASALALSSAAPAAPAAPRRGTRAQSTMGMAALAPPPDSPQDDLGDGYYLPPSRRRRETRERYVLGAELGRGHYATVVEALDSQTNTKVAVKIMDKRTAPASICQNELRILEELRENGGRLRVTPIMDAFEDARHLYLVLELMRGGDFFDKVSTRGRIPEAEAAVIMRKLCFVLGELHRHNILHRDVKLENLLLDGEAREEDLGETDRHRLPGSFKLGDMGFAKKMGAADAFKNPAGTLGYVAPEVLLKRQYGPACDVWSAGVVLYMMLAGHAPFPRRPNASPPRDIEAQVAQELEAIEFGRSKERWTRRLSTGVWMDVSQGAKDLVTRMLHLNPAKRITTEGVLQDPWIQQNTILRHMEYNNYE